MPYLLSKLPVPHLLPSHIPDSPSWPFLGGPEYSYGPLNIPQWSYQEFGVKKISPLFALVASLRLGSIGILGTTANMRETSGPCKCHLPTVGANTSEKQSSYDEAENDFSESCGVVSDAYYKEEQRRKKIGLANKGKVPWNKGKKHSEETRMRIKRRTIEALRDPKVRKKMVEQTRSHSEQTKAKIKSSLRRIWDKRLKWRRLKEKFFLSWLESIAETAKRGGSDQQELHWDSYEKIKQEIAIHQLQLAAEKLKAKEMAKLRGQKAALAKADKMARLAEKRKEREEKTKARRDIKMGMRKSKKDKEMLVITPELKLKQKLTKIHRQRSQQGRVASRGNAEISVIPAWEKLDEELIKKEKMRKSISLAEQIQAAKNRRVESMVGSLLNNQAGASRVQTGREGRWEGRELQTEVF